MLELNHKVYEIYGNENKSVEIKDPKTTQILRNGKPNGVMLSDVFKKIDDLEEGKIWGWSVLEFYKVEEGFLVDNNGNNISLLEEDNQIFFKKVKDPLIILNEKEVSLDYVKDVSTLLGLTYIEQTITGLEESDVQVLVEEREFENEKRRKQSQKEKAEIEAREKLRIEEEERNAQIEAEKEAEKEAEEKIRAEWEKAEADAQAEAEEQKRKEEELRIKIKADAKAEAAAEIKLQLEQERKKLEEEEEKIKEKKRIEEENAKNIFEPKQFRSIKKSYSENGFQEYVTLDGKYIFFYSPEMTEDDEPMLVLKRSDGKYEEIDGELTEDSEKIAEFDFTHNEQDNVVVLNKSTNSIKIEVIA